MLTSLRNLLQECMLFFKILFISVVTILSAFAEKNHAKSALETDSTVVSIGGAFGFPTGLSFQFGVWNLGSSGFINVSGGTLLLGGSVELEGGYLFDRQGFLKQGISIKAGSYFVVIPAVPILQTTAGGFYTGPSYKMLFWDLIYIDLGVAFFVNEFRNSKFLMFLPVENQHDFGVAPIAKIGVNWFF